jgi:ferritin-like metal-binding protein YciE
MPIQSTQSKLQKMFVEDVRDLLDAEKQLVRALPKIAKNATDPELEAALREHVEVTKQQVQRLEQIFETLDTKPRGRPCQGMKGIVEEGQERMQEEQEMLDAGIAGACRKVEHYEIVSYENARAMALQLGMKEAAELLRTTLQEEMQTDRTLAQISKRLLKEGGSAGADQGNQQRSATRGGKSVGSKARQSSRGNRANGVTTDHEEIRQWAEQRGAHPACVKGTGGGGDTGMIRLDFPGYSGGDSLQEISWDDWFEKFDRNNLALLYQENTAGGQKSNFNKLVRREGAGR